MTVDGGPVLIITHSFVVNGPNSDPVETEENKLRGREEPLTKFDHPQSNGTMLPL